MIRARAIAKYLGYILLFNALFLFISAAISFAGKEGSFNALLTGAALTAVVGSIPLFLIGKIGEIKFHEGLSISILGWVLTCVAGMIPYYLWGGEFTLANALFESVSGYTTTGSSILSNVEALPKGMLFWRSSTSLIGGLGIILFVLLVLPEKRGSMSSFYRVEVSELSRMNFVIKGKRITRRIATVYFILIAAHTILLYLFGMSFFDAVCHSFSTIATSGFSTKNLNIAHYNSVAIELVILFFMLISSMHFGLIYATMTLKKNHLFASRPTRMYVCVMAIGILFIAFQLAHENLYEWGESFRHAAFQVVSLASTTGYATVDTAGWPLFSIILLLYFSIQCGMIGSTAGGIKFDRVYLFFVSLRNQLRLILHPNGVYAVKMNGKTVDHAIELQVMVFIILYLLTLSVTALLLTGMGMDGMTSFSASIATIGNVGPGFGSVSSLGNFGHLPDAAKYILSANMLLGRLEIMNVFALIGLLLRKR